MSRISVAFLGRYVNQAKLTDFDFISMGKELPVNDAVGDMTVGVVGI